MFEVSIPNAKMFKSCVDAIVTLIDEGEFHFSDAGLSLRAMDPSQIAMVDFVFPRSAFEKYEVESTKLGLNLEDLARVMGRVRSDEQVILKLDDSRLVLTFKGQSTRRFVIPLLDIGGSTPKEPNIEFSSHIKFNGNFLKDSLKDTSLVSSHVVLNATPDAFIIEAQGDKGEVSIRTDKGADQMLEYDVTNDARAMYPLEYMNDLLKGTDSATNVELSLRTDAPLKLSYAIDSARITYFLAPRIETQ